MQVIIYTTPSCVYCKMAKEFFKEHNVQYEEKNVAVDDKAREDMITKAGEMGGPVIEVEGPVVVGFGKERLSQLLGIN